MFNINSNQQQQNGGNTLMERLKKEITVASFESWLDEDGAKKAVFNRQVASEFWKAKIAPKCAAYLLLALDHDAEKTLAILRDVASTYTPRKNGKANPYEKGTAVLTM